MKKVKKQSKKIDGRKQLGQIRKAYHQVKKEFGASIDKENWPGLTEQQIFIRAVKQSMGAGLSINAAVNKVVGQGKVRSQILEAWNKKKDFYEERIETYGVATKKELFIQEVTAYLQERTKNGRRFSVKQAVKAFESSTLVRTKAEIDSANFMSGIDKWAKAVKDDVRRAHGWKKKLSDVSFKAKISAGGEAIYSVVDEFDKVIGYVYHKDSPDKENKGGSIWHFYEDKDEELKKKEKELESLKIAEALDREEREKTEKKENKQPRYKPFNVKRYVKKSRKARSNG